MRDQFYAKTALIIRAVCGSLIVLLAATEADPGHWPHDCLTQLVFDRKHSDSFKGWKVPEGNVWKIEGHRIVATNPKDGRNSILWTEDSYTDFILDFDFKLSGASNSGVMIRNTTDQIQIGWSPSRRKKMTGSLFRSGRGYLSEACMPVGLDPNMDRFIEEDAWNRIVITSYKSIYEVEVNGFVVMRHKLPDTPKRGPIGLQIGSGGSAEFRNLQLASEDTDVKNTVADHYTLWLDESGKSAVWRSVNYREMIKWGNGGGLLPDDQNEDTSN
ncbi:MAG: DUF1080 domain-containing protein [Verrucomicrobiota bacterium]